MVYGFATSDMLSMIELRDAGLRLLMREMDGVGQNVDVSLAPRVN